MAQIKPKKTEYFPLPTETDDGTPRYLLSKVRGRVENSTYPGAQDKKVWNAEFTIQEPDIKRPDGSDAKIWKSFGLTVSGPKAKRVSDLTTFIIAVDPVQTRESLEDGYETDDLNDKLVKIRVIDKPKQNGDPGQKVVEWLPVKKSKSKPVAAEKKDDKGIDY